MFGYDFPYNKMVLNPRAAPPLSSSLLRRSGYAKAQSALAEAAGNLTKLPVRRPRIAEALAEAQAERKGGLY